MFGSSLTPIRGEWGRTGFVFREPESDLAYGLKGLRNGTRGLLTVVQAYVLKNLLFAKKQIVPGSTTQVSHSTTSAEM